MTSANRKRTTSQIALQLKELMEEEQGQEETAIEIINEWVLTPPVELIIKCSSIINIEVAFTLKEDQIPFNLTDKEQNFEEIFKIIKQKMMIAAGASSDTVITFDGETDPWCDLITKLSINCSSESLKLQFNTFSNIFCYFKNLQQLELNQHLFTSIHVNIANLIELKELILENCRISKITELGVTGLKIEKLNVKNNKISGVPKTILNLQQSLTELDLSNNQIKELVMEFGFLNKLKKLDLSNNKLSKLPVELKSFTELEYLNLSNNNLGSGIMNRNPLSCLSSMVSLIFIDLSQNKLSAIPSLDLLSSIRQFNLSDNLLTDLPFLTQAATLLSFDISNNQIQAIGMDGFKGLVQLTDLNLSNNKLKFIPATLANLKNLKKFDCSKNKLATIPDSLCKLPTLTYLDLSNNELVVIQNGIIGLMNELQFISLQNNKLSRLPDDFFKIPKLTSVDVSCNFLLEFSSNYSFSSNNVTNLNLSTNSLSSLPDSFCNLFHLQKLYLHENPLTSLPLEFVSLRELKILSIANFIINFELNNVTFCTPSLLNSAIVEKESFFRKSSTKSASTPSLAKSGNINYENLVAAASPFPDLDPILKIIAAGCQHEIIVFALAEFAAREQYQNYLQKHLDAFLHLLSSVNPLVVIHACRALASLALNPKLRTTIAETSMLLETLFVLASRFQNPAVASRALSTIANLCLDRTIAKNLYKNIHFFIENEENNENEEIRSRCRQILATFGYTKHLYKRMSFLHRKRGVRILCMDGGGTKSVSTILFLQELEKRTGKRVHELFDLIGGTSVGGILSCLLGVQCLDATQVSILQKRFFREIFTSGAGGKNEGFAEKVALLSNFFSTGGRYNTAAFERILREVCGEESLIESASRLPVCKVFVAAMQMDVYPPDPYLFRNYCYPPDKQSRYRGGCERKVWEGLRATSAAPSMFSECVYDNMRFSDGGMAVNNPTGLAYHEYLSIWGRDVPLDCIVSVGTGAIVPKQQTKSIKDFVLSVIESATSVARVDDIMEDFLPSDVYYRFNVSDDAFDVILDETRDDKIAAMEMATTQRILQCSDRIQQLANLLTSPQPEEGQN